MLFVYTAKDKDDKIQKGSIEATDKTAVTLSLHQKGLFPVKISPKKSGGFSLFKGKVPLKEKIIFSEQLEIMVRSGLSIIEALKSLQGQTQNKRFAQELAEITANVEGGMPLSEAIAKHEDTFGEIYANLIRSGEKSGKVDLVLKRLSSQLQKEYELNRKIKGALAYPVFVLFALLGVMVVILVFVIPQLTSIFEDSGVALPLLTRIVIGASDALKHQGLYVAIAAGATGIALARWKKTASGKHFFDILITKIPVIGNLMKKTYMARFTRTFAALTSSGLPLLEVLKVSGDVIGNSIYQKEIDHISMQVKNGQTIAKTLKDSPLFPDVIGQLAVVGERSGKLDEVFDSLADFFDRDVDAITSNLSTLLEPILIVIIGIGAGGIVASVLQPIYGLVNTI